jgi:hypothetical protein
LSVAEVVKDLALSRFGFIHKCCMCTDGAFGNLWMMLCSASEFVIYKLKELGKIDQEDVLEMLKEFQTLDRDQSGTLNLSDIKNTSRITQSAHAA